MNAARRGDIVYFYATGLGQTTPAGVTGKTTGTNLPIVIDQPLPVTVTIGGVAARILYDGPAPGMIAGISQINVLVPANAPTGATVPLVLSAGNATSQTGLTVAVK